MKPKQQGKAPLFSTQAPMIETLECDRELETRGIGQRGEADSEKVAEQDAEAGTEEAEGDVSPYLGNRTPCPHCGAILLQDRTTQACIVTRTMPERLDEKGAYTDRYLVCKSVRCAGRTFRARERKNLQNSRI